MVSVGCAYWLEVQEVKGLDRCRELIFVAVVRTSLILCVGRLFHISTWTSTACTLAIHVIHPSFSRFLILVLTLDRHVAATVLTVSLVPRIPPSHSDTWKMALKTYVGP